jgi:nucleoside phosphorylase
MRRYVSLLEGGELGMTNDDVSKRADFAVVCALEVEREAVCRAFQLKDRDREVRGKRRYWRGRLPVGSKTFGVVVTQLPEMANVHAGIRTSAVLQHWSPQALLLVGIAAAALESQRLGDVVVGRSVYYYELGKASPHGPLPQPDMIHADTTLYDAAVTARKWRGIVGLPRPDGVTIRPERSFADIASGEKVVGDPRFRDEVAKPDRKIRALEMEGYGFSVAALQAEENIQHLVIRGLCDYADQTKGDEWHAYASASAAAYARHLLRDWPFEPLYEGDEREASVTPIWASSAITRAKTVDNLASTSAAVIELTSLAADIVDGTAEALTGQKTTPALRAAFALPRYRVERALQIVQTLYDLPRTWPDEGGWRFRYTDLVEAIHESLDLLTAAFDSLLNPDHSRLYEDPVTLAGEIQANVIKLQALLNNPTV